MHQAYNSGRINLVNSRKQDLRNRQLLFLKVQFVSIAVLVLFVGAVLVLYGVKVYAARSLQSIQETIASTEDVITKQRIKEAKYRIVANKLHLIESYAAKQAQALIWLDTTVVSLPDGIEIVSAQVDNDKNTLTVQITAPSMAAGLAYLDQLETATRQGDQFGKTTLQDMVRNQAGTYTFKIIYSG